MVRRDVDDKAYFGGLVVGALTRPEPNRGEPWAPPSAPVVENTEMPSREEIVEWLKSLHLSMWGGSYLLEKERPLVAADWILSQITSFLEWRNNA